MPFPDKHSLRGCTRLLCPWQAGLGPHPHLPPTPSSGQEPRAVTAGPAALCPPWWPCPEPSGPSLLGGLLLPSSGSHHSPSQQKGPVKTYGGCLCSEAPGSCRTKASSPPQAWILTSLVCLPQHSVRPPGQGFCPFCSLLCSQNLEQCPALSGTQRLFNKHIYKMHKLSMTANTLPGSNFYLAWLSSLLRWTLMLTLLTDEETQAQRGEDTCHRSHSK